MFHAAPSSSSLRCDAVSTARFVARPSLSRLIGGVIMLVCLPLVGGCRLCADCDLDAYPAYGGTWQRTNRDSGRVGSIFDPGGSRTADLAARADSEANDTRNRARYGDDESEGNDAGNERPEGQPADDIERSADEPEASDSSPEDGETQEMEDRFRNLELQDINLRSPAPGSPIHWQ